MMIQVNPPRDGTWRTDQTKTCSDHFERCINPGMLCFIVLFFVGLAFPIRSIRLFQWRWMFSNFFSSFKDGAKWGVRIETAQELQPEQRRRHGLGEETTTAAREWGEDARCWLRQPASFGCRCVVGGDDCECEKKIWGSGRWWW